MRLFQLKNERVNVLDFLRKIPMKSDRRLQLYAYIQRVFWRLKYSRQYYRFLVEYQPFAPSSFYYGHEYWLKRYSGFKDKIYSHIEHGINSSGDRSKVANEEEWDLGNIITYGESRKRLLEELYPDYNVFPIGPRIHYAETDQEYYSELYNKINHSGKVLTLYPAHSLASQKSEYDSALFLKQAEDLAERIGARTIMVSLHPSDYIHKLDLSFRDKDVIIVGGGSNSFKFLPRLRAILELSDLTFTNALGTHTGYSIYMKTPQVINLESNLRVDPDAVWEEEQKLFAKVFNGDNPLEISQEQWNLCDYYYGYSYIKSPDELYKCLESCKTKYEERFKRHKK